MPVQKKEREREREREREKGGGQRERTKWMKGFKFRTLLVVFK